MELLANVGIAIAAGAAILLVGTTVIAAHAAVRGKQTARMAQGIFSLAGVIMIGGGLVALSVPLVLARAVGGALLLTGLSLVAFALTALRPRARM